MKIDHIPLNSAESSLLKAFRRVLTFFPSLPTENSATRAILGLIAEFIHILEVNAWR